MDMGKQSRLSRPPRISESSKVCITVLLLTNSETIKISVDNWNKAKIKNIHYIKNKLLKTEMETRPTPHKKTIITYKF